MLYRYTLSGEFAGDTWHESVERAKNAARWEYGGALGEWTAVPEEETNAREFAVRQADLTSRPP